MTATEPLPLVALRAASGGDATVLREWRNDADAVRFSGSGRKVSVLEHQRWLVATLSDRTTHLWIAEEAGAPVGQVRVDTTATTGVISIAVAAGARGRGLGQAMLRATLDEVLRAGELSTLTALVHPDNFASIGAFERVGFQRLGQGENGFVVLEWRPAAQEGPERAVG